jgi:hypothetical protein
MTGEMQVMTFCETITTSLYMEEIFMAEGPDYASKAQDTFSAERKEDFFVLVLSAIATTLVMLNIIGPSSIKSLFF